MPAARPEGLQRGQQQFQHFPGSAAPSQGGLSHPNAPYPIFPEGLAADQYQSRVLREAVNALPCLKFEYHWWYDRTGHNGPLPTATPARSQNKTANAHTAPDPDTDTELDTDTNTDINTSPY